MKRFCFVLLALHAGGVKLLEDDIDEVFGQSETDTEQCCPCWSDAHYARVRS